MLALSGALALAAHSYFWIESERMAGVAGHWQSWVDAAPPPGWHWNGPGVSAEWGQGGESGFNSIVCGPAADRTAIARESVTVPHGGRFRLDWKSVVWAVEGV